MRVFISYSRAQRARARAVEAALSAAGHQPFLDEKTLPPSEEYNSRIRRSIQDADLFVFLASPDAIRTDSYARTELSWAQDKWPNPSGRVLPVTLDGLDADRLPSWLGSITALGGDEGNLAARVVAWADGRAESGTAVPGVLSPREQLERWARLAQPPLRKGRRVLHGRALVRILFGVALIAFGVLAATVSTEVRAPAGVQWLMTAVPVLVGAGAILHSIFQLIRSLRGGEGPLPVLVLDRDTSGNVPTLEVQTLDRGRISVEPVGRRVRKIYGGDMGWAWIRSGLLLDFVPASEP